LNIYVGDEAFRVSVAIRPDLERQIEALLLKIDRAIFAAFEEFLANATNPAAVSELVRLLEQGRIEEAANFVARYSEPIGLRLQDAFRAVALFETRVLREPIRVAQAASGGAGLRLPPTIAEMLGRLPKPSVSIGFDPGSPRAVEAMRALKDEFIRPFNNDAKVTLHAVITDGLAKGTGIREVARQIRDVIGLSNVQVKALDRYRRLLADLDPEALTSVTRDRRFDGTIRKAIKDGKPLTADQIEKLVAARRRKMIQARGEAIAMNESAAALNRGREEGLRQMVEESGIDPLLVVREWRSMRDRRVRNTHIVLDGQKTGMEGVFVSPSGATLRYPRDPKGPTHETAGCRCYVRHTIKARP
jgi:hypothetical protein